MTQLSDTSSFVKRNAPPVVFAVLIGAMTALIYYRYFHEDKSLQLPPQQQSPAITSLPTKASRFSTDNLTVENKNIKNLPIYTKSDTIFNSNDTKIFLKFFSLENNPKKFKDIKRGDGELFTTSDAFLVVYKKSMVYQAHVKPNTPSGNFDQTTLEQTAIDTLQKLGATRASDPTITYSKYIGESLTDTSNPNDANYINFLFDYQLDQLLVTSNSAMLKVSYTSDGSIFKIEITPFETEGSTERYPLVNINQALELLKNGNYLTNISGERDDLILLKNIANVDLNKAYLAYYFTYTDNKVQPVWVFEGTGKTSVGEVKVKYAVPAIEERFYKSNQQNP